MTKISALTSVGDGLAVGDQFIIRDIDDAGTPNKSVTISGITRALQDGTVAAPALAFANDKNTGIYRPGDDQLAISTGGSNRLHITSAGLVGIGNSSVSDLLHIGNSSVTTRTAIRVQTGGVYSDPNSVSYSNALSAVGARYAIDGTANGYVGQIGVGNSANLWLGSWNNGATDGSIQFATGNNTTSTIRATLNSTGLGIGTTGPQAPLHVRATAGAANDRGILIQDTTVGTAGEAWLSFKTQESTDEERVKGAIVYANAGSSVGRGNLLFLLDSVDDNGSATTSDEKMRITYDGKLLVGTATQVGNVNGGILQLGSGITFPATAVAASDANTLDDYEEGTWTPALKVGGLDTGITYSERAGQYIKIGKLVYIRVGIFLGTHAGLTGTLTITTLPFTPQNVDSAEPFFRGASAAGFGEFTAVVTSSSTTLLLRNPTTFADLTDAVLAVGTKIYFTGCYPAV